MPRPILLSIQMLTIGYFMIPLLCNNGYSVFGFKLSTLLKSQSKYDSNPEGLKSILYLKNRRSLLSTAPKNESHTVKDDSIGAKIREFYADDNNMALFCILPLLILVYGGCSVIYCVYKCRQNLKKKKREQKLKSQTTLSTSDTVSLISGNENMAAANPKRSNRPFSSKSNRVAPAPSYEAASAHNLSQKLKQTPNGHVKDLLTDYEFFASWVMAQKAAELIQLGGESSQSGSSTSRAESASRNCGTTVGCRKKKLVFLS